MQLQAFIDVAERFAPSALAEKWDNIGLLIEPESKEITRVLVALDCTVKVAQEAARRGAQLVLTHHPLFFEPVRRLYHSEPETAAAYALVRHGIGLFVSHTNLDSALNGVNDVLAAAVGLTKVRSLLSPGQPLSQETLGVGRIGILEKPVSMAAFAQHAASVLGASVRIVGNTGRTVQRVAVIGGNGGSCLKEVKDARADVLLTGEIKHDQALAANVYGLGVIQAGHYETESVVLAPWIDGLQRAFKDIQYSVDFMRAKEDFSPMVTP